MNALASFSPNLTVSNTYILDPFPSQFTYQFIENLVGSQTYTIQLNNIADCWMNTTSLSGTFALAENP